MKHLVFCIVAMLLTATARAESEIVTFPVTEFSGETVTLTAVLNRPEGDGPFPAVVLLHGCDGLNPDAAWTDDHPFVKWGYDERPFLEWGYVTLWIDSFGSRGQGDLCDGNDWRIVSPAVRSLDAHSGKDYLTSLPFVDAENVVVVGWSHSADAAIKSVSNDAMNQPPRADPFKAAVAFYPYCSFELRRLDAPLLVLIGDRDTNSPAGLCEAMTQEGESEYSYELVVYPGATHAFDWADSPGEVLGHNMTYDPEATEDAYRRIAQFFALHLQQP